MSTYKKIAEAQFERMKKDLKRLTGVDEVILDVQNPGDGVRFQIVFKKDGKEIAFLPSGHYRTSDFLDYLQGMEDISIWIDKHLQDFIKKYWK